MSALVLIWSAWLVAQGPGPPSGGDGPKAVAPEAADPAALAEYNARRARLRDTAEGHWALGLWCEQHALKAEAEVEFTAVTRLDPKRDAAWKKLGFTRRDGRWLSPEQLAASAVQKEANKVWGPRLARLHDALHDKKKREAAVAELAEIKDEAAIPSIWNVLGKGGVNDQLVAVEVLGHIATPSSSQMLAILAVYGKSEDVCRRATQTLRGRDLRDFASGVVGLLRTPLKFEVMPVNGPGSAGMLVVEGEQFHVRRVYAAPGIQAGQIVTEGSAGVGGGPGKFIDPYFEKSATNPLFALASAELGRRADLNNLAEAMRSAVAAEERLERDVAALRSLNGAIRDSNQRVSMILTAVSGRSLGEERDAWSQWLADVTGTTFQAPATAKKATISEFVPLDYVPSFVTVLHVKPG
jgi:hypothetical protein